ncbi:MAG: alanine racemase [Candidatus Marinimicrobia bacterium]|nr:alanine racemase [Candidatus Neomarinimicrobiota bacterium]MBL7011205.1 alanine racemase [Candidatus Neomarinimicrobiota bacterium]MBL7031366.1 alanine racemase [Candidatus Neomarinimicrobiota bacterium]
MVGPKAIIHLDRLKTNFDLIKNQVNDPPIMAVVKANGYGHGGVACARVLESYGCGFFAVFTMDEGIELRQAGIQSDILIFSRIDASRLEEAVQHQLTLNLCHEVDIPTLTHFFKKNGVCPKVHLKVDTGMTRLGIDLDAAEKIIQKLKNHPELQCEGIFSHFATADEGDLSYAHEQELKFKSVLEIAEKIGYGFTHIHFSNSGSVINLDQSVYNMVRVGMVLYGAFPSHEVPTDIPIKPVMEFIAPIVTVRNVPAGTPVSYGGVFTTISESNIGVIQCGFADGIPRQWYQKGHIMFKGNKYKIAGRICMDQFMVNFEDIEPDVGEEVLIMGDGKDGCIRMEEIAEAIDSTPYVLATGIGGRTQRIFQDKFP